MAFPFAIPIAATIGGYAIDKMMGGNGMTGAGVGLSAGTMGADGGKGATAGAATTAGGTTPALLASTNAAGTLTNAGAVAPGVFDGLSLGAGGYDATAGLNSLNSGSNLMSAGNNIASNAFTLPTEVSNVLDIGKEYAGKAYDYVDEGLEGMSFSDKLNAGAMGYQALGQQDPTMQRVTNGEMLQSQYQNPRDGLLDISVAGPTGSEMTRNELTPEQLAMLGLL
tara:strand:- start:3067 stop:3738 length:672 start_codon:yes stop_codon:yes gene_type:complete